ncbi:hypothetical protein RV134_270367 [Roseovarius sp. EC-HK134]|nr:hypothetical protein RV134_270367 [Roseovarius sp. EC-HK134]VVT16912.1 hypothetical protein RV420_330095 [Roseovarius sp. EC-SD190]
MLDTGKSSHSSAGKIWTYLGNSNGAPFLHMPETTHITGTLRDDQHPDDQLWTNEGRPVWL